MNFKCSHCMEKTNTYMPKQPEAYKVFHWSGMMTVCPDTRNQFQYSIPITRTIVIELVNILSNFIKV